MKVDYFDIPKSTYHWVVLNAIEQAQEREDLEGNEMTIAVFNNAGHQYVTIRVYGLSAFLCITAALCGYFDDVLLKHDTPINGIDCAFTLRPDVLTTDPVCPDDGRFT